MVQTFFDVEPFELSQLSPELAVDVLRQMLWAEVNNLGIPISETDIPFAINVADGGIDAVVTGQPEHAGSGLIFPSRTSLSGQSGRVCPERDENNAVGRVADTPLVNREASEKQTTPCGIILYRL